MPLVHLGEVSNDSIDLDRSNSICAVDYRDGKVIEPGYEQNIISITFTHSENCKCSEKSRNAAPVTLYFEEAELDVFVESLGNYLLSALLDKAQAKASE